MSSIADAVQAYERGDFVAALRVYEALAKEGHAYSLVPLARMYIDGKGTRIDLDRAEILLNQAVKLGVREAVLQKAVLHRARGQSEGYFRSVRDAAEMGLLPARYLVGLCYLRGEGVAEDASRAAEFIRDAASQGHLGARIFLARKLLKNPLRPAQFVLGAGMLVHAFAKSLYLAFHDPNSDLLR
jgi:uncharacterized protein